MLVAAGTAEEVVIVDVVVEVEAEISFEEVLVVVESIVPDLEVAGVSVLVEVIDLSVLEDRAVPVAVGAIPASQSID